MKQFTHLFIVLFIAIPIIPACSFSNAVAVKGNGTIVNKELSISDYSEIVLGVAGDVVYRQFSEEKPYLQINVDENILPLLEIKVENNRLKITTKDHENINPSKFTIYTNSKNLSNVTLAGSGEIYLKGEVNSKDMNVKISGSGNVVSDSLYCEKMDLTITGSGDAKIAGASNQSSFTVTGSGNVNAYDYFVRDLNCKVTGSGNMDVSVSEKLDATVTGSGNINYKGEATAVNSRVSGSGKINRRN